MSLETSVKKDLPPVVYKPNINRDPEHHAGTEITFDEKVSVIGAIPFVPFSHSFLTAF